MNNRLRSWLLAACALVLLSLLLTIINFTRQSAPALAQDPAPAPPVRVLAPFEQIAHRQVLTEIAEEYSARPDGGPVELVFVPHDLYKKEISIQLDQGKLADVIICENVMMPALIGMGIFQDITPYVTGIQGREHYYASLWQNTMSGDRCYGLPFTCDPYALFYNKQLFARKDADVPRTWDELLKAAYKTQDIGTYGFGVAMRQPEESCALFLQLLYCAGASIREINSADGMRAFELLGALKHDRIISRDTINWNQFDLTEAFTNGEVAMMAVNLSNLSAIRAKKLHFDVGLAGLPVDKRDVYLLHGKNIGVTVDAGKSARAFLEYLATPAVTRKIAEGMNTVPVRMDVDIPIDPSTGLDADYIKRQIISGKPKGSFSSWFDISLAISDGMYDLMGQTTLSTEDVADAMQDRVRMVIIAQ